MLEIKITLPEIFRQNNPIDFVNCFYKLGLVFYISGRVIYFGLMPKNEETFRHYLEMKEMDEFLNSKL